MNIKKVCYFCTENIKEMDYKDTNLLRRFITPQSKIASRKRTGTCSKHQRQVAKTIKRARLMGLLPFVSR